MLMLQLLLLVLLKLAIVFIASIVAQILAAILIAGIEIGCQIIWRVTCETARILRDYLRNTFHDLKRNILHNYSQLTHFFERKITNLILRYLTLAIISPLAVVTQIGVSTSIFIKNTLQALWWSAKAFLPGFILGITFPALIFIILPVSLFLPRQSGPSGGLNYRPNLERWANDARKANEKLAAQIGVLNVTNFNPNRFKIDARLESRINSLPDKHPRKEALAQLKQILEDNGCSMCLEALDKIDPVSLEFPDANNKLHTYIFDRQTLIQWVSTCSSQQKYVTDPNSRLDLTYPNKVWTKHGNELTLRNGDKVYRLYRGIPADLKDKLDNLVKQCESPSRASCSQVLFKRSEPEVQPQPVTVVSNVLSL